MDRSISPLPNPPSGQPSKISNKLTASALRSQSPSQSSRPPKKKKKVNYDAPVVKEETATSLQVTSHDPVTQQDLGSSQHKVKFDRPKPPSSSYATSQASFSSSLSSSESDMEEVSMPTIAHGNSTMITMGLVDSDGMLGAVKREKSSDHDSSSSASDSSSSESQSDDDSDEVRIHNITSSYVTYE